MAKKRRRLSALFNRQNTLALGVLLLSLLVYAWVSTQADANLLTPEGLQQAVTDAGIWGVLVYIAVIALAVVMSPIPGAPLTIAAGAVWGAIPAGIYSVIGGFSGSLIAYFIGRSLGRSAVKSLTGKIIYFSKEKGEWLLGGLIFVTRLLPVLSFDLISYGAGLAGLSLPIYASSTLLGMIPSTLLLTYLGESFTLGAGAAISLSILFVILLVLLPWGIRRYNWFGLRDVVRIE
ncbi:TVP38/TMEM64 family protein [cf. Phormidesmis sp. LEGE 11477]|uniref:TVP38/TMEM64 family protein n=1 Tax=cf. Phormidesmis sp. LEGE 11477 TaxID=1828680 RepID=UPI00187F411F|nr:TVP38/TMEM64 family protein [cf. Phormidesmis sp. LEGE 11477]MBE9062297.1 TVP38/TMEM64 family protein [cf. Phormidesmis sp. LEGE 11477]